MMKERILKGWTFIRVLYLIMGSIVIVQSVLDNQWFGVAFGGYFAAMGLFAFGCASGNCFGSNCDVAEQPKVNTSKQKTAFEEINSK